MDEYIEKHLYDVLLSIEETESYFESKHNSSTYFKKWIEELPLSSSIIKKSLY
ncbi:Uncharacterised protein [Parabacteroides distasonis]|uniref:Uncharacterized protein n=1 Tax=Parabacteroides distasonis TaxID=823 RepID=A0A174T6K9_PARDI|nr:Uncharacterised protein [Parabacteroides distasonis]